MKIGRNDPCPCGSGKKYKKCCLAKDEAAAQQLQGTQAALQRELALKPEPPPESPLDQARNALWKEFEATKQAKQPALFDRALAAGDVLDAELAFEMICAIRDNHERAISAAAIDALRTQRPDLYQHDAPYYLDWQIEDALVTDNLSSLPALCTAIAATAGKDLDTFYTTLEQLEYHQQLDLLAQMMALAWPHVRTSSEYVAGADDEFAWGAMDLTLFARFEQNPDLSPDDPKLLAELEAFGEIEHEKLSTLLALLAGQPARRWTLDDFAFRPPRPPRRRKDWYDDEDDDDEDAEEIDPAVAQLHDLTFAFLGVLAREQGVSLAKGDLARKSIERYIVERHAGELGPVEAPLAGPRRPKAHKPPAVVRRAPAHPLCPDRATLDRFLAEMMHFITPHYYQVAATLELMPAWLTFLEGHGLLTAEQRAAALTDLRRLVKEATPIWQKSINDPAPGRNIQLAWEQS